MGRDRRRRRKREREREREAFRVSYTLAKEGTSLSNNPSLMCKQLKTSPPTVHETHVRPEDSGTDNWSKWEIIRTEAVDSSLPWPADGRHRKNVSWRSPLTCANVQSTRLARSALGLCVFMD